MIENISAEQVFLAEVDVLRELPHSELEYLATRCPIVHLARKESFTLDESQRGVLFLINGRVRVHELTFKSQDLTFSVFEGGTVVGQPGSKPRPSRAARVQALEASVLRVVGWEDFENLVLRNPKVGLKIIRLFGERLEEYEGRLSDLIHKEVLARLAGLLLRLSEREGVAPGIERGRAPVRYTHQQLASMVGSNREAVTRALGVLKKAGAVEIWNRQIYVADADALERLAGVVR